MRLKGGAILCYFLLFWGRRPHHDTKFTQKQITSKLSCIRGQQGAERKTFVGSVEELIRECKKKIHSLKVMCTS